MQITDIFMYLISIVQSQIKVKKLCYVTLSALQILDIDSMSGIVWTRSLVRNTATIASYMRGITVPRHGED